jgi:HSP20 family protein
LQFYVLDTPTKPPKKQGLNGAFKSVPAASRIAIANWPNRKELMMKRSMVPWTDAFRPFGLMNRDMGQLMDDFFGKSWGQNGLTRFEPEVNIAETEAGYEFSIDVPGIKPEDVKVEYHDGRLTISGERKEEKEEKGKAFHRTETTYGSFQRSFALPGVVDDAKITAQTAHGVLKVMLPKSQKVKPRVIQVTGGAKEAQQVNPAM